jgi:ATP-dependent DNA helicase RecG
LQALEATCDGFELAEVDLRLRGEGTILGSRQKGRSDLKLASLRRHRDLLDQARMVADALVGPDQVGDGHPLEAHPALSDELRLFLDEDEAAFLFRS